MRVTLQDGAGENLIEPMIVGNLIQHLLNFVLRGQKKGQNQATKKSRKKHKTKGIASAKHLFTLATEGASILNTYGICMSVRTILPTWTMDTGPALASLDSDTVES